MLVCYDFFMRFKYLLFFLVIFLILFPESALADGQAWTSDKALNRLNSYRQQAGLKPINLNQQLCTLGKLTATHDEQVYPQKTVETNEPQFAKYRQGFVKVGSDVRTTSDLLIKAQKLEYKATINEEWLSDFPDKDSEVAMYSALTDGCVAVSPGGIGYKQFAVFVGGVKTQNGPAGFFQQIINFVSHLFGKQ